MTTQYSTLRAEIARVLQDPSNQTFTDTDVKDITQACMAEIGRVAPDRFQQDITPSLNQLAYTLRQDVFSVPVPELELVRVEMWDGSQTPDAPYRLISPASGEYTKYSDAGWFCWDGVLELPRWVVLTLGDGTGPYFLRVWGYSPYPPLVNDTDICPLSHSLEQALLTYARVEGLQRLNASRELFTQWQTRSGNSDISPAGLMNALNIAQNDWRQKSRAIFVLREAPGGP